MQLSPQSQKVYEILLREKDGLAVSEIAFKLRVAAGDIYRLIEPLLEIGLIRKTGGRPFRLFIRPANDGLNLYLLDQSRWFQDRFGSQVEKRNGQPESMQLEFIQGRDDLMRVSATEIDQCSKSVDLLRSGHEIPANTMRALVQAIKRGAKVRMLIQDYDESSKEQVVNWIKNGISIKKTDLKYLRLMLYDSKIGYFMSYKHSDSGQDLGMKLVYQPIVAILQDYFDRLWRDSKPIFG
jgi:sugar-specific transcriptional regulator TrmB